MEHTEAGAAARQEIESLEQYLRDQRDTHQRFQVEASKQAARIEKLEAELAQLQDDGPTP